MGATGFARAESSLTQALAKPVAPQASTRQLTHGGAGGAPLSARRRLLVWPQPGEESNPSCDPSGKFARKMAPAKGARISAGTKQTEPANRPFGRVRWLLESSGSVLRHLSNAADQWIIGLPIDSPLRIGRAHVGFQRSLGGRRCRAGRHVGIGRRRNGRWVFTSCRRISRRRSCYAPIPGHLPAHAQRSAPSVRLRSRLSRGVGGKSGVSGSVGYPLIAAIDRPGVTWMPIPPLIVVPHHAPVGARGIAIHLAFFASLQAIFLSRFSVVTHLICGGSSRALA